MEVAGCVLCRRCPNLVIREIARRTGGLCGDCLDVVGANIRTIEVSYGGRPVKIRSRVRRPGSRGSAERAKLSAKCREKAARRVAKLFPNVFEVIVADERARAGLEPWPFTLMAQPLDAGELDRELDVALRTSRSLLRYRSGNADHVQQPAGEA
jgi:hypothetical protein